MCTSGASCVVNIFHIFSGLRNYDVARTLPSTILMQNAMYSDGTQNVSKCFKHLIHRISRV